MQDAPFGVIEGFYGDPWTWQERADCIDSLAAWGADTYVWAPKSEPRHRDLWEEPFTRAETEGFRMLAARDARVRVSVALTPGNDATVDAVIRKLAPAMEAGCTAVTLCFDDLPVLGAAHRHRDLANGVHRLTGSAVWLVPTHYAGTRGSPYLDALVDGLDGSVLLMWTGTHVVNDSITAAEATDRAAATGGRPPLVWDNVPVNDAMMTDHLHMGPFAGRDDALRRECAGFLLNPMVSQRASMPTIRSACAWWRGEDHVAAWSEEATAAGLLLLAQATSYPGDPHWPGDDPGTEWLEEVAAMADTGDPDLDPWVQAARRGASISLHAMNVIGSVARGVPASDLARDVRALSGLREWLRLPSRTLGAGPRTRPFFTQDASGRFAPTGGVVRMTRSIPESLAERALAALDAPAGGAR